MSVAEKLTTIAENQQKVYDAGYNKGKAEGGDTEAAYQQGKEAERKAVWDAIQDHGNRADYSYAFHNTKQSKESFRPVYDIRPTTAAYMFDHSNRAKIDAISMTDVEESCGIVFDFSNCTDFNYAFCCSCFNELNVIDLSNAAKTYQAFYNGYSDLDFIRINRLIFSEKTVIQWGFFGSCSDLEYVGFEGTIANSIDIHWSPLVRASLESAMSALSGTTTGLTASFKKTAVEAAFTTDEWNALVATKSNWTITLA